MPTSALLEDGTVNWGKSHEGPGAVAPPAKALTDIRAVASCEMLSYAVRNNGSVICWRHGEGEVTVPNNIRDVVEIAAGIEFAVALTSKGKVLAWGKNTSGECDVPSGLGHCVAIRASSYVGAARMDNGKWVAWGTNMEGLVDQIGALETALDVAYFGNNTRGYSTFLLWIE